MNINNFLNKLKKMYPNLGFDLETINENGYYTDKLVLSNGFKNADLRVQLTEAGVGPCVVCSNSDLFNDLGLSILDPHKDYVSDDCTRIKINDGVWALCPTKESDYWTFEAIFLQS